MRHRPACAPVRPLVLASLLAPLLLAGCADDHAHHAGDGHGDGPIPPSLLVGVENKGSRDVQVKVRVLDANDTEVWTSEFVARAGALPEKQTELPGLQRYTVVVEYAVEGAAGGDRATLDPSACAGLHHITFVVDATEAVRNVDLHRECHE